MARIIGIVHRTKKTKRGKARPTKVAVIDLDTGKTVLHDLETETDELDWVLNRFPTAWRDVAPDEDVSEILGAQRQWLYHCKTRERSEDESLEGRHPSQVIAVEKTTLLVTRVPTVHDGLKLGDTILMTMGGSGSYLMYALSNRCERQQLGTVFGINPHDLKRIRGDDTEAAKADDHLLVVTIYEDLETRERFKRIGLRERDIIEVQGTFRDRMDTQRDRIRTSNRIHARTVGAIFRNPEGEFPEGSVDDIIKSRKANSKTLQHLLEEEAVAEKAMHHAVHQVPIWNQLFAGIEGCGERIAAGIIGPVIGMWRFAKRSQFEQFTGVATRDGKFQRSRRGEKNNSNRDVRQSLVLLGDQFNRRPGSQWGKQLRYWKQRIEQRCAREGIPPEGTVINVLDEETGKSVKRKRWYKGHRHRWALWRTLTRFSRHIYWQWKRIEREQAASETPTS